MYRRLLSFAVILLILSVAAGCQKVEKKPIPLNNAKPKTVSFNTLSEAAGADTYIHGCVSCHKKEADVDRSLPAYVKRIEGHPEVKETTVNTCYGCHEAQKNYELYKRFYRGIHKVHWGSNAFYTNLKCQCYSCHTAETNGVSGIKEYPLAGYRASITGSTPAPAKKPIKTESITPETGVTPKQPSANTGQSGAKRKGIPVPIP